MKEFLYKGDSAMNFNLNIEGKTQDFCLIPGEKCSLPEQNDHVKVLFAKGILVEAPAEKNDKKTTKNQ